MKRTKLKASELSNIPVDPNIFKSWDEKTLPFDNKFHIAKIEEYIDNLRLPLHPHRRTVYFFMFVTQGVVIRSKGLTNYEINPNHCFFLPAHQITSLDYISNDACGYYCHFTPEIFSHPWIKTPFKIDFPFFQTIGEPLLKINDSSRILSLFKILESIYTGNKVAPSLITMYLLTLLSEFAEQTHAVPKQKSSAATLLTQQYISALSQFIYEKKTVAAYAAHLSVTTTKLQRCVKTVTGKSAHQLLDEMRLLEAKMLLKQSSMSIGEIAYKIGEFNHSDFSRFFKSKTNLTPLEFRQQ